MNQNLSHPHFEINA